MLADPAVFEALFKEKGKINLQHIADCCIPLPNPYDDVSPSENSIDSTKEYTPKRPCTSKTVGTTVEISKDFLKKLLGPAADRLEFPNNVLTSVIAAVKNHGDGDIQQLSLS